MNKVLSYQQVIARRSMSVEMLSTAAKIYEKSHLEWFALGEDFQCHSRSLKIALLDGPHKGL